MISTVCQDSDPLIRRSAAPFLAFSFTLGLVAGIYAAVAAGDTSFSLMRGIRIDSLSIVRLTGLLQMPFLFSAVLIWIDPVFVFPVCFVRAFLFAFVHLVLFGSAGGWGMSLRWLILFSDCLSLPVLYFFWHRRLCGHRPKAVCDFLIFALVYCIGFLDYYAVGSLGTGLQILQKG